VSAAKGAGCLNRVGALFRPENVAECWDADPAATKRGLSYSRENGVRGLQEIRGRVRRVREGRQAHGSAPYCRRDSRPGRRHQPTWSE